MPHRGLTPARALCASGFSEPNRGRIPCASESKAYSGSTPCTSTDCLRLSALALQTNASRPKTVRKFGKIDSVRKLSVRARAKRFPTARPELVSVALSKEAMPVVRYRTRDLTRLLPGTAPAMRRMEKATGRSDDIKILRGVNFFPSQIEKIILSVGGLAPHIQLRLDALKVQVESLPEHADASSCIN